MTATLTGLSLGPGDPDLITRAAWHQLAHGKARWAYPVRSARHPSYALDIVRRSGLAIPDDALELVFPMTRDPVALARAWQRAANSVCETLEQGRDVQFLVEGDASTYATFSHLARTVRALRPHTAVHVIPGINSFSAAAARADYSLAEEDDTIAILPAAYGIHTLEQLRPHFDTFILMKVKPQIDAILDWLAQHELLAHSVFVEKAGSPDERIISDIASLRGQSVNYLSLIIVRQPNRPRPPLVRGCRAKKTADATTKADTTV